MRPLDTRHLLAVVAVSSLAGIGVLEEMAPKRDPTADLLHIFLLRVPHRFVERWGTVV